jgi:hypothetical protein
MADEESRSADADGDGDGERTEGKYDRYIERVLDVLDLS